MMFDLPALKRALLFSVVNPVPVAVAAGLYGVVFAFQSYFTALAGAGDVGAAPIAFGFAMVGFFAFVLAMASWGRIALGKPGGQLLGLAVGADEVRVLLMVILVCVLLIAVLPVIALFAVAPVIAATVVAGLEAGLNADQAEGASAIGLLGTGGLILLYVCIGSFAVFSLWFFLRLAMAYPATLDASRIQIMSVWPLSGRGRSVKILTTTLAAALPGVLILVVFNLITAALLGVYPAAAQSASGEAGALSVAAPGFMIVSFLYGVGKAGLVGAPVCAALCALYRELKDAPPTAGF
ncbi:hypothetical protein NHF40_06525 [Maricaulaceae bacterium EIL42A08]|nr:hypothetical protein [Maricaulaceae bacterium EIL42A08]